jgi:hypothetical protein
MEYLNFPALTIVKLRVLNLRYVSNASILEITIEEPVTNCWY